MSKVLTILLIIAIVVAALLLLVAVSGLVVLAAAAVGWALINWLRLPFSRFEATLLSLISLGMTALVIWRVVSGILSASLSVTSHDEDQDYEEDEDEEDYYEDEEEPEEVRPISSIPKWRQPIRRASDGLPIVAPDDRCPCGSGRKYKNCHGRKGRE